ncbi:alpha/beta hydrolase [Sphingobacteriaceae bacterium]|nr:alpha/beta hydrolase [Sphingobacteriaceae bacterium]
MKNRIVLFCLLIIPFSGSSQNYIFYLHGKIVENQGPEAVDKVNGYGEYRYYDILDSLKKNSTRVISEVRAKDTDLRVYAQKIKREIDSLIKMGIPPSKITVIGASKGALIAMYVSAFVKNKAVNYVFMAACYNNETETDLYFYGNILSIYEKSDLAGSCQAYRTKSSGITHYKEIQINTGLKHGFLYRPISEWINPARNWAAGTYN